MDRESFQERFGIRGSSAALKGVIDRVRRVADTDITVLLQGESGVGKELLAEALHALSMRRHEEMVIVNCGAIPEGLIESELFGAEKGAYTGAVEQRSGYFEEADGSTIFLDEIGEMPQAAQVRLLRVLETGRFARVGSSEQRHSDVRVVAATNKDLAEEVERGRFREDLYYRLSTVVIDVPPLRERPQDILPLFERFLHEFSREHNASGKRLTDDAGQLLRRYRWPGNIRELKNVAEQAVVLLRADEITADALRPYLRGVSKSGATSALMHTGRREKAEEEEDRPRERELLYRAVLELQMDMREVKEQLHALAQNIGVAVPRALLEGGDFPGKTSDYVVMPGGVAQDADDLRSERDYGSIIEDVVYEIEESDASGASERRSDWAEAVGSDVPSSELESSSGERASKERASKERASKERASEERASKEPRRANGREAGEEASGGGDEEEELPTLEDAEGRLIRRALRRFDGNRRQTARALGISERTLYRKLKDIDEDL